MIRSVEARGFKALGPEPLVVELAPLTLIAGANGAGKSSLLELLALTAQSAVEQRQLSELVLSGSRINLALASDASDPDGRAERSLESLCHGRDATTEFGARITLAEGESFSWLRRGPWGQAEVRQSLSTSEGIEIHAETKGGSHHSSLDSRWWASGSVGGGDARRLLAPFKLHAKSLVDAGGDPAAIDALIATHGSFERFFRTGLRMLSELRSTMLAERKPGPLGLGVGAHGEGSLRLVADASQQRRLNSELVQGWFARFGLEEFAAGWHGGSQLTASFRLTGGVELELERASSGQRQAFILLTELLMGGASDESGGRTILIEEPELHLHPAWELAMAELFAEVVRSGDQIVASTHSELLIAACLQLVRRGDLEPDQVQVLEFSRSPAGEVEIEHLRHSDRGNLEHGVPSFAQVEDRLWGDWLDGVPELDAE